MSRFARLSSVLVLTAIFSLPLITATAQDATEETIFDDPGQMTGIQYGVSRDWSSDADLSTPAAEGESVVYFVGGLVFEFDNDDNADAAFDQLKDAISAYVTEQFGLAAGEFTTDDLDDDAFATHGLIEQGDEQAYFKYVVMVEDEHIFVSATATSDEDASNVAVDLVEYMEEQDDDATGLGEFNEDGSSTGGLWEFFPAADNSLFEGLSVEGDTVVYPQDEDAS